MKILVLNSGSSSIKYQLLDMPSSLVLISGLVERIGESNSWLMQRVRNTDGDYKQSEAICPAANHREGFNQVAAALKNAGILSDSAGLSGVGHRVVHGGETFHDPVLIDSSVIEKIRALVPLAPLHNPANLLGITVALEQFPSIPQVAVFDTAFHHSLPPHAYHYALPKEFYATHGVRRYGFHGTSHCFAAKQAAAYLRRPLESVNLITLHLGNGASATAIQAGRSIDTSMGLTPLEGLIMGTRCGDLDPAIHFYLERVAGMSSDSLETLLNHHSGLNGICGASDMREIHKLAEAGSSDAALAIDMFCYRIKKYIGAYYAALGKVDALIFTGGIGENNAEIRQRACDGLAYFGISVDDCRNCSSSRELREIQADNASVKILVVPANEELEIARQTLECIQNNRR